MKYSERIDFIIDEILDQYMYADKIFRPWIIGFSGDKDSTVLLTLTWLALLRIKEKVPAPFQLRRPIYVVCNDTLVENPIISTYVDDVLEQIQRAVREQDLPIFVRTCLMKNSVSEQLMRQPTNNRNSIASSTQHQPLVGKDSAGVTKTLAEL